MEAYGQLVQDPNNAKLVDAYKTTLRLEDSDEK
jgi:hypothetical protein